MDSDRLLRELTEFLRIPSVSTLPAHNSDCRRAAEWVAAELRHVGCRDVQFLGSDTHPVVWGVGPQVPGAPTLLLYGHYDVQPPDPLEEWTAPPFAPTVRDGQLFARGAADDKGQVFCLLKAIESCGRPPVNFRFLIEGEEEYGSKVLFDVLRREPRRTQADAVLVADMAYVAPGWPAVYTALRGIAYAEITVRTAKSDLHSGEYGGAAPNAHEELCRLLGRLKGPDGKINVPGLYRSVQPPSKAERALWKQLPFKEREFLTRRVQAKALVGMKKYSVLERLWALPTFEIHGITGGFTGNGAKTVIPAEATAKVSLRLVPHQTLLTVERQLAAAVQRLVPKYVTARRSRCSIGPSRRSWGGARSRRARGARSPSSRRCASRAPRSSSPASAFPTTDCTRRMRSSTCSSCGMGSAFSSGSTNSLGKRRPGTASRRDVEENRRVRCSSTPLLDVFPRRFS